MGKIKVSVLCFFCVVFFLAGTAMAASSTSISVGDKYLQNSASITASSKGGIIDSFSYSLKVEGKDKLEDYGSKVCVSWTVKGYGAFMGFKYKTLGTGFKKYNKNGCFSYSERTAANSTGVDISLYYTDINGNKQSIIASGSVTTSK